MGAWEKLGVWGGTLGAGLVGIILARDYLGHETAQYVQGKLPQVLEYMQNATTRAAGNLDEFVGATVVVAGFGASLGVAYLIDRYAVPQIRKLRTRRKEVMEQFEKEGAEALGISEGYKGPTVIPH